MSGLIEGFLGRQAEKKSYSCRLGQMAKYNGTNFGLFYFMSYDFYLYHLVW